MYNDLITELKAALAGRNFKEYDDTFLQVEIKLAIGEINRCRKFTPTDKKLYDKKYEYLIVPMCIASIAKIGAEGQTSHSENGITRYYSSGNNYPKELTQQIIPLVK